MVNDGFNGGTSVPLLTNCVFWNNGGASTFFNFSAGGPSAIYCLFDNTVTGYTAGPQGGNLTTTVSPFASTTSVALATCSPAINAGNPATTSATVGTTDLAGNPRFVNNGPTTPTPIDMGAVEFQGTTTLAIGITPSLTISLGQSTTLTASNATTYSWSSAAIGTPINTSAISVSVAGTYSVTGITGSCSGTASVAVLVTLPCQSIIYVSQAGAGLQNGSSWANAYPGALLQTAITAAASCSAQVWVAAGLYKPTSTTTRTASFSIPSGVQVYGGFVGTETALGQRYASGPGNSILSGEIGNLATTADNSYHVVRFFRVSSQTRLDGFVITGGNANNSVYPDNCGGGVYNAGTGTGNSSNPVLTNCVIQSNAALNGGGIYNDGNSAGISNPVLTNCSFQNNSANSGGAIYNVGANSSIGPVLTNCSFQSNSASSGGAAIRNLSSSPTLTNCVLFGNGGTNTFFNNSASVTAAYRAFS